MSQSQVFSHYYASNTLGYNKDIDAQKAVDGLPAKATEHNPDVELPVTLIRVYVDISVPYAITYFLPHAVTMMVLEQDYESNIELNTLCMLEDGIVYYGDAV